MVSFFEIMILAIYLLRLKEHYLYIEVIIFISQEKMQWMLTSQQAKVQKDISNVSTEQWKNINDYKKIYHNLLLIFCLIIKWQNILLSHTTRAKSY